MKRNQLLFNLIVGLMFGISLGLLGCSQADELPSATAGAAVSEEGGDVLGRVEEITPLAPSLTPTTAVAAASTATPTPTSASTGASASTGTPTPTPSPADPGMITPTVTPTPGGGNTLNGTPVSLLVSDYYFFVERFDMGSQLSNGTLQEWILTATVGNETTAALPLVGEGFILQTADGDSYLPLPNETDLQPYLSEATIDPNNSVVGSLRFALPSGTELAGATVSWCPVYPDSCSNPYISELP